MTFLWLFVTFNWLLLQEPKQSLKPEAEIEGAFDFFSTDNLGFIYLIKDDVLQKFSAKGELLFRYSNKRLGKISSVDFNYPLKPILFYDAMRQLVVLDNTLSVQGDPVALDRIGFNQVALVCNSVNGNYWFYDQQNLQLIRASQSFQVIQETGNLAPLLGHAIEPNHITEVNEWVYLNNPSTGIMVFDIYGTYYKTIPIKDLKTFQVFNNGIYYTRNQSLLHYNFKTLQTDSVALPENQHLSVRLEKNKLYLHQKGKLKIYSRLPKE